jgi:hypothetical protein
MKLKKIARSLLGVWDSIFHPPYSGDDGWNYAPFRDRRTLELRWSRHRTLSDDEQRAWVESMFALARAQA